LKYEEQEFKNCWISTVRNNTEKGVAMFLEPTPQFYEAEAIKYEKMSML
jgi:ATP-binding cassette subfamily B protein